MENLKVLNLLVNIFFISKLLFGSGAVVASFTLNVRGVRSRGHGYGHAGGGGISRCCPPTRRRNMRRDSPENEGADQSIWMLGCGTWGILELLGSFPAHHGFSRRFSPGARHTPQGQRSTSCPPRAQRLPPTRRVRESQTNPSSSSLPICGYSVSFTQSWGGMQVAQFLFFAFLARLIFVFFPVVRGRYSASNVPDSLKCTL